MAASKSSIRPLQQYNQIQDYERLDCNGSERKRDPTLYHRLLLYSLSVICLGLIVFIVSGNRSGNCQLAACSGMKDIGSDLLITEDHPIITKIGTTYHYLERGFDDDDFIIGDPFWGDLFPGMASYLADWI